MDYHSSSTDPRKIQLITDLLRTRFANVVNHGAFSEEFVVRHDGVSSQLGFALEVLDERSLEDLKRSMVGVILPILLENPGKRVSVFTTEVDVGPTIAF